MLTEIEVEGVGTIRELNMWQIIILKKRGRTVPLIPYAMAAGMTVSQFKRLPMEKQAEVRQAYLRLTSPANVPDFRNAQRLP